MRVMVFAKGVETTGEAAAPSPEAFQAMDEFTEALVKAGVFVAAAGLKNDGQGKRLVRDGEDETITDGPFADMFRQFTQPQASQPNAKPASEKLTGTRE